MAQNSVFWTFIKPNRDVCFRHSFYIGYNNKNNNDTRAHKKTIIKAIPHNTQLTTSLVVLHASPARGLNTRKSSKEPIFTSLTCLWSPEYLVCLKETKYIYINIYIYTVLEVRRKPTLSDPLRAMHTRRHATARWRWALTVFRWGLFFRSNLQMHNRAFWGWDLSVSIALPVLVGAHVHMSMERIEEIEAWPWLSWSSRRSWRQKMIKNNETSRLNMEKKKKKHGPINSVVEKNQTRYEHAW